MPGAKGFGKCRRKLVRACKKSTPEIACSLGTGASGNVTMNGIDVEVGDAATVGQICPTL